MVCVINRASGVRAKHDRYICSNSTVHGTHAYPPPLIPFLPTPPVLRGVEDGMIDCLSTPPRARALGADRLMCVCVCVADGLESWSRTLANLALESARGGKCVGAIFPQNIAPSAIAPCSTTNDILNDRQTLFGLRGPWLRHRTILH